MCKMAFAHLYVSFLLLVSAVLSAQGITGKPEKFGVELGTLGTHQ